MRSLSPSQKIRNTCRHTTASSPYYPFAGNTSAVISTKVGWRSKRFMRVYGPPDVHKDSLRPLRSEYYKAYLQVKFAGFSRRPQRQPASTQVKILQSMLG